MKILKHIVLIQFILLLFAVQALAQNSARMPIEGTTHSYTWSGIENGMDFDFYITASADGSGLFDDNLTMEFDIETPTGVVGADNKASTMIAWNTGASLNVYYVWLQVTNAQGCSNYRYVQVTPQLNQFDLLSENMPVDNTISCPSNDAAEGFDPINDTYSSGATVLQFKVRRENGTDNTLTASVGDTYDWSFIPQLTVDPDLVGSINAIVSVVEATKVDDRYYVSGDKDEVIVTVTIDNAPGYDLDVTLAVTDQQESNTNLSDSDPSNDNVTHTIQVMPLIDGMGGI